jgi:hypothetical protein
MDAQKEFIRKHEGHLGLSPLDLDMLNEDYLQEYYDMVVELLENKVKEGKIKVKKGALN